MLTREIDELSEVIVPADNTYGDLLRGPGVAMREVLPGDAAWLFYTSGTTGRPKGAMISQGALLNLSAALEEVYAPTASEADGEADGGGAGGSGRVRGTWQRVSLNAPLSFDASVKQWLQLLRGRTVVIVGLGISTLRPAAPAGAART